MLKKILRTVVLLAGALSLSTILFAQPAAKQGASYDAAATFSLERAQVAQNGSPSFWLKGGSLSASASLYKSLGLAANLTVEHTSKVTPGRSLGKIAYMFGPRSTFNLSKHTAKVTKTHTATLFGEALFGGVHGYDSLFPAGTTTRSSASAFSMQLGGGIDVELHKGFGIRPIELDYVHTSLPNNAANSQNDLRIGFGISWRK